MRRFAIDISTTFVIGRAQRHATAWRDGFKDATLMAGGLSSLRKEMRSLGFDWPSASKLFPEWAAQAAEFRAGEIELRGFAARHFGLRLGADGALHRAELPEARFKTSKGTEQQAICSARALATACAKIVAKHTIPRMQIVPSNPVSIRETAIARYNHSWVDFGSLVELTWALGIPVVHLPSLPTLGRKMEGMVTFVSGRPVVVLAKKSTQPDWLLFILAHELAHICLGHLPSSEGQAIIDDTVEEDGTNDHQEQDANLFASKVLTHDGKRITLKHLMKAELLVQVATDYGRIHRVSPGHVILNAVNHTSVEGGKPFGLAQKALKLLPSSNKTVAQICKDAANKNVNARSMKDDDLYFLEQLSII